MTGPKCPGRLRAMTSGADPAFLRHPHPSDIQASDREPEIRTARARALRQQGASWGLLEFHECIAEARHINRAAAGRQDHTSHQAG